MKAILVALTFLLSACTIQKTGSGTLNASLGSNAGLEYLKTDDMVYVVIDKDQVSGLKALAKLGSASIWSGVLEALSKEGFAHLSAKDASDLQEVLGQQGIESQQIESDLILEQLSASQ